MRLVLIATALGLLSSGVGSAQDKLAEQRHQDARDHYRRGEALMMQESFEKAAAEFTAATRLDLHYTLAFYSLGQASMVLKRYGDAATAYEACRKTLERRAGLDTRVRGESRQERVDELREIEAAIMRWGGPEAPPNMITMRLEERRRLLQQQQEKDSINRVEIPPELSIALGSAYFRLGRLGDAEGEYSAAIEDGDKTGAAHNNVAVIYMMTDRLDEARASLRRAEEAGFRVDPRFKEDLLQRAASSRR
jgi:tetratricopeptide (TPR) repeat protein